MGRQVGDFPIEELWNYRPNLSNKPGDFNEFWENQKEKIGKYNPTVTVKQRDYPVHTVEVFDLTLNSWDNTPLQGILVKPANVDECPVIVNFPGYTGSCGLAVDYLKWVLLGVAVVDVRGQGNSPDFSSYQKGSRIPGWMLSGIQDREGYYYTNVYRDILTELKWVNSVRSPLKASKLGVMGSSQGGGLALCAAGLDGSVEFVLSDWPFLAHFDRALDISLSGPYMEVVNYFKWNDPQYKTYNQVRHTLGYIDSVHFCDKITCPVLMAAGLEDAVTPPSTVFAAFNHLGSSVKEIEVYPQFTHELNPFHDEKKLQFIASQINT